MIRNPNDDPLLKRIEALEQLLRANPLRNASFGSGGITVYDGGSIRFTEGGGIVIEGDGYIIVGGDLTGDGTFQWTGPWTFNSPDGGEINGDVDLAGNFDLTGVFKSGNIRFEDGKIYVGEGASQIVIDGATGKITVGGMAIDPADGGKVTFPGGAQLRADVGDGIQMQIGTVKISAQTGAITLSVGTRSIGISSTGIRAALPTRTVAQAGAGSFPGAVISDSSGNMFRVIA